MAEHSLAGRMGTGTHARPKPLATAGDSRPIVVIGAARLEDFQGDELRDVPARSPMPCFSPRTGDVPTFVGRCYECRKAGRSRCRAKPAKCDKTTFLCLGCMKALSRSPHIESTKYLHVLLSAIKHRYASVHSAYEPMS
jgi:hypothetical protein